MHLTSCKVTKWARLKSKPGLTVFISGVVTHTPTAAHLLQTGQDLLLKVHEAPRSVRAQ